MATKGEKEEAMEIDNGGEDKKTEEKEDEEKKDVDSITLEKIREDCRLIERGETSKEGHYVIRVLRGLSAVRKSLNASLLSRIVQSIFINDAKTRDYLLSYLPKDQAPTQAQLDGDKKTGKTSRVGGFKKQNIAETEIYINLLVLVWLIDQKKNAEAETCINHVITRLEEIGSRRSMEALAAKAYFYYVLIKERNNKLPEIREWLQSRLTGASIRHEEESEAVLINALLRSYLVNDLYQPALKLVAKVTFPENANSNEWARHFYYLGCMKAMACDYAGAQKCLSQALGKAPRDTAIGFKQRVIKVAVVVDLLLAADFPERSLFRNPHFKRPLAPYLLLTKAVRIGDVHEFNNVVRDNHAKFEADGTFSLISRLRQNVIKTAIRQISLAYSRISVADVGRKLDCASTDDAEYILCKAMKEGVMEGAVEHEEGWVSSGESKDVYTTPVPAALFNSRINFCLKLHNQAVKAMRFPAKSHYRDMESAEEQREREQQELEFAKELAEDDEDFA